MNIAPHWFWDKGLSDTLCDLAISDMNSKNKVQGSVGDSYDEPNIDAKIRDSKCVFFEQNYWLEGILFNFAMYANKSAGWNYSIDESEVVQLSEYSVGGHYDWHEDWSPLVYPGFPIRKLSVVCLLSDPSEFEGGSLEFESFRGGKIDMKKGSVIVFPSFLRHRVNPVTSGIRRSAVIWLRGKNTL